MVVPECGAGPAILFADLRVPYSIIHRCHVVFHDEILHRGITYTYASRYLWCGTYGKPDFRDFPKKNSIRHITTQLPEIFLKNFYFTKILFGILLICKIFFPVAKFS